MTGIRGARPDDWQEICETIIAAGLFSAGDIGPIAATFNEVVAADVAGSGDGSSPARAHAWPASLSSRTRSPRTASGTSI